MDYRTVAAAGLALLVSGGQARAQAVPEMNCDQLWFNRMQLYAQAGLCFDNPQGRRFFEQPNCRFRRVEDVRLSAASRRRVDEITRAEREKSCPPPS